MANPNQEPPKDSAFQSIHTLRGRVKDGTFSEIIDDWKWIFSYSKKYKGAIAFYTLLGIVSTSLSLVSSILSMYLIDMITGRQRGKIPVMLALMIGSAVFSLVFSSVISRISARLSIYINNDIQADIFDQILDADWLAASKYSNGDIMNRFNSDVNTVASNAISWLPTIVIALYNFVITFWAIAHRNLIMALIAFGSAPFMLLMSKFLIKKQRDYRRKTREMSSKMMTFEVETFYNYDTIKSFGITDQFGRKLRDWQEQFKDLSLMYNMFTIKTNVFMSVLALGVQMLAFLYCLWLLWTDAITFGTMTFFLQQRTKLSGAFNNVVSIIPNFLNSSVSAHRIRELVELPREVHLEESSAMDEFADEGYTVRMEGLNFAYVQGGEAQEADGQPAPDAGTVIWKSDFEANPGEIVALIGPSGEGKTTMIRLILGLVRPQDGRVTITAKSGMTIESNADSRHLFAYVPQGNTILSGTIAENMRMVKEDATDDQIVEALKVARAWDFVEKMPDGINSLVRERGRGLSEGQSQRVAIARAILRDAPILLLDEATSALDVQTEREVLKNIIQECPNKTCIVTSHRPSVLNLCKRIYRVMDKQVTELDEEQSAHMAMDF
ncbi:MAG: ABC transporter ATP-binding protein [Lachnospiraceae bacterium]|nr:ABC transporter ATP-binding protein [Lachnospiraceae bacterium]